MIELVRLTREEVLSLTEQDPAKWSVWRYGDDPEPALWVPPAGLVSEFDAEVQIVVPHLTGSDCLEIGAPAQALKVLESSHALIGAMISALRVHQEESE